jgi:phosphoribosylanthranilate isomerase
VASARRAPGLGGGVLIRSAAGMRVKICGITTPADAALAVSLGADAVGVLVGLRHASDDEVDPARAATIVAGLPPFVAGTLVTHRTELGELRRLCGIVRPQVIQLHGGVPREGVAELRREFPALRLVGCVHVEGEGTLDDARRTARHVDAIILDTKTTLRMGGTGTTHDWSISRRVRETLAPTPVILAGGLTPDNVAGAIAEVRPYAVDVNSGVSLRRGVKSAELIERFIRAARR